MPAPANAEQHVELIKQTVGALTGKHIIWRTHAEGDFVVVEAQWVGKHTGDFNGVAATGNPVSFTFIDIMEIKDGKISNEHMELNPMSIMAQIGAMPG
jgi:predicted ester cyclase